MTVVERCAFLTKRKFTRVQFTRIPSYEEMQQLIKTGLDLVESGSGEKVRLSVEKEEIEGFMFPYNSEKIIITDYFIGFANSEGKVTQYIPFAYFFQTI